MGDREVVAVQIGRPLRAEADVVVRCRLGVPVVTRVPPTLEDGTPFPTLFWLSCPLAVRRIGRIEAAGGVASMDRRAMRDPVFGADLETAHADYAAARDELVGDAPHLPTGGVGGARVGVKCLHAHYAHHAAGGSNPVGAATSWWVDPLDCEAPCVIDQGETAHANREWREPV
ncbi:MAG: hypothetical protein A2Z12_02795 [Actinobacteria bacterium RBG_16_68_21]|nr:MAG: hypothetical protein A2Z12_02795 [Actinobacteria bacterium RBG_16_68_21]